MLDLDAAMARLSKPRPIFNSEADFQFALAWELQTIHPDARVRLEYRPVYLDRRGYLDLWLDAGAWRAAIEVKYFTRALDLTVGDERFELLSQEAQDIGRYDYLRDVVRVETVAAQQADTTGYALALTNDSSYWRPPTRPRPTNDAAFRIHEGVTLSGERAWAPTAGAGTTQGRTQLHVLKGSYRLRWRDYSRVVDGPAGAFRYLLIQTDNDTQV